MASVTLRSVKGAPLTNAEVDANFSSLNTDIGTRLLASNNLSDLANATTARSNLGLGNVENKSSATIRGELTSSNVTTALGFTPYNSTNPSGYITGSALTPYLTSATAATTYLALSGGTLTGASTVSVSSWSKWTLETIGVTAKARQGSDANGLNFTSNAQWTGSAWVEDDTTKKKFAYIQHLGNSRHEFRTSASGTGISWVTSLTIDDAAVNSTVALTQGGNQVLHAGNYTSYSPSLTGSGASGTWGINVTGSAGSVAWSNVTGKPTAVSSFTNDSGYITSSALSGYLTSSTAATTYLPLTGGSLTGDLGIASRLQFKSAAAFTGGLYAIIGVGPTGESAGVYRHFGIYDYINGRSMFEVLGDTRNVTVFGALTIGGNTALHAGNYSSYALPLSGGSISYVGITNGSAINFKGAGSGTYNTSWIYSDATITSWESPLTTDASNGAKVPLVLSWRGGYSSQGGLKITGGSYGELGGNAILHAGNYSSYALPLSGGTVNGKVTISGSGIGVGSAGTLTVANDITSYRGANQGVIYLGSNGTSYLYADGSGNYILGTGSTTLSVGGNQVLHAGNYTSYSPSLTGSGASGTWGINISGSLTSSSPQLAAATESNSVYISSPSYTTGSPVKLLNFDWYGNIWALGNIRSGGTASNGFGVYFQGAQTHQFVGGGFLIGGNYALHAGNYTSYVTPTYTGWPGNPGTDANSFYNGSWARSSFTYANNAPFTGPLAMFPAGGYDLQFNSQYSGHEFSVRARNGDASSWMAWKRVLTDYNYNSYSPTLTGGNASGTWGINITGNAATATKAGGVNRNNDNLTNMLFNWSGQSGQPPWVWGGSDGTNMYVYNPSNFSVNYATSAGSISNFVNQSGSRYTTDVNSLLQTGFYNTESQPSNSPVSYGQIIVAKGIDTGLQIAGGYNNDQLYFRGWYSYGGGFTSWRTVLHNGNYTSYSPSLTGSGASGTWSINITGSSNYVSGLTLTSSANGINPDTVTQNQIGYNTSISLFGQTDGGLYSSAYSSAWIHQIYGDFRTGQLAVRGKNSGTWQAWRTVLDSSNYGNYATWSGTVSTGDIINLGYNTQGSVATSNARGIELHVSGNRDYWIGKRAGGWTQPFDISFYTGVRYHANRNYNGHRFYVDGYDSTLAFSVGDGDANTRVYGAMFLTGDNYIDFGANSTWGATLRVGGNGWAGSGRASVVTTNGNLHLDPSSGNGIYLGYYSSGGPIYATANLYSVIHSGNYSSYALPLSGGSLSGGLNVLNGSGIYVGDGSSARMWIGGSGGANYIESGNNGWSGSANLYITGYNGSTGGTVNINFSTLQRNGNTVLDASNYTNYVTPPVNTVRGTGGGTWGARTTGLSGDSLQGLSSGFYDGSSMSNMPTTDWYHLIVNAHNNSFSGNQYEFHIATPFWDKSSFYMRSLSPGSVGPWRRLIHDGNYSSSIASNGYQKLPSGLIIQWGSITVPSRSTTAFSFPITFPNGCFTVNLQAAGGSSFNSDLNGSSVTSISTSQFQVWNNAASWTYYYMATGY